MDLVETPINLCRATSSLSLPMLLRLTMVSHTKNALVHPFIHLNKYITNSLKLLKHFNGLYKHFKKLGYAQVRLCPPPTFGQTKCSNFAIFSYFVIKIAKCSYLKL